MGRKFISIRTLGPPFYDIRESMFLICPNTERIQRSPRPKILFFLDGKCRITIPSGFDEILNPGDILILPNPCRHTYSLGREERDTRVYTFGLFLQEKAGNDARPSVRDRSVHALLNVLEKPTVIPGGFDLGIRQLVSDFRRECEESQIGSVVQLKALALSMLVAVARKCDLHPARDDKFSKVSKGPRPSGYLINEVKEFLLRAQGNPLTLGQIAWHVKLSEEHLARIFKKETGMTVMDYLRFLRVEAAKTYLLNTNETIETLARRLGFGSVNPFCRTFKKSTRLTPTKYRAYHAGDLAMPTSVPKTAQSFPAKPKRRSE